MLLALNKCRILRKINIDRETGVLIRDNVPAILNPFDAFAVEEVLAIEEKTHGFVTALTMGPKAAIESVI